MSSSPSACFVSKETINCGEGDTYKIVGALPEPTETSNPTEPNTPTEGGPAEEVGSDSEGSPSYTVILEASTSEDVPYGASGGMLVNDKGEEILALEGDDPYFALAPAGKGEPWLVSNGSAVIAVSGNDELWRVELPEGSLEVNGFNSAEGPSWSVSGNVLLVGEPGGILALDTKSGEQIWRLDAEVSSWRVDGEGLVVSNGSSIAFMQFPQEKGKPEANPQSGPSEVVIGEEGETPAQTPLEDLLDATLEVPEVCAEAVGLANPVTFSEGRAKGKTGFISVADVSALLVEGELLDALAFSCESRDGDTLPAVAVYNQDLELWGVPDFLQSLPTGTIDATLEGLLTEGSALQILISGPGVVCDDCEPGAPVQVTMLWDGEMFITTSVGQPSLIWEDPSDTEKVETGPLLTPEDLANITLTLPQRLWQPGPKWEQYTFSDYQAVVYLDDGSVSRVILEDETVEARVNGEDFLFTSIVDASDGPGGGVVGGLCAISMEGDAVCATNPSFGSGFIWPANIVVDGQQVTYMLDTGEGKLGATVTQRFDGNRFTLIDSTL